MSSFTLSGTGSHAISAGVGQLEVHVSTVPANVGEGNANPTNLYGVGFIRATDGTSFWRAQVVDAVDCWIGLPTGTTSVSWSMLNGGIATATEVFADNPFRGSPGATGATGATGPAGPTGPTGPAGGSGVISTASAVLGSAVAITVAQTFTTGLSLTLGAGTWFVQGQAYFLNNGGGTDMIVRLNAGATVYSVTEMNIGGGGNGTPATLAALVVLTGSTTITLQATTWAGVSASFEPQNNLLGQGNHATQLLALQVA